MVFVGDAHARQAPGSLSFGSISKCCCLKGQRRAVRREGIERVNNSGQSALETTPHLGESGGRAPSAK